MKLRWQLDEDDNAILQQEVNGEWEDVPVVDTYGNPIMWNQNWN